jgi:hypothetical protein
MRRTVTRRTLAICTLAVSLVACQKSSNPTSTSPSTPVASVKLAVNQPSYGFPTTTVGQTAQSPTFELSATGTGSLTIATITSSNPGEFILTDVANCIGTTLVGGTSSSCKISIKFQPAAPGVRSSKIVASSSDGSSVALDLFGSAVASSGDGSGSGGGAGDTGGGGTGGGGGGGGTGGGTGGSGSGGGGGTGGTGSDGGSFAQAVCIPNGGTGIALTTINSINVPVQLTLTGPQQIVFSLQPGDLQVAPIIPGNYTVTGQTPGSNITFKPSGWVLLPGCDYILQVLFLSGSQSVLTVR